jgi:hypothetical protein
MKKKTPPTDSIYVQERLKIRQNYTADTTAARRIEHKGQQVNAMQRANNVRVNSEQKSIRELQTRRAVNKRKK